MPNSPSLPAIPQAAVSGAIFRGKDVLLARRGKGVSLDLWSLPGGHIEAGETAAEALARELEEETGITARLGGVADTVDVIRRNENSVVLFHRVIVVFYGVWLRGEPQAASDVSAVQWRHWQDMASLETTPGLADVVQRAWRRMQLDNSHLPGESP